MKPRRPWPAAGWLAGTYLLYLLYLLNSGYAQVYADSGTYWELAYRFFHGHAFALLHYNDSMRGYAYPLLNVPGVTLQALLHLPAATAAKMLGAAYAALVFAGAAPRLWAALTGADPGPTAGRRVVFVGLGFVFWRDYFNFPMSDFPALLFLLLALLALYRWPGWRGHLLAGAALALAVNIRPIYLAAVPFVVALAGVLPLRPGRWYGRAAGFGLGLTLVLLPQFLINQRHFQVSTPLVLAESAKYGTRHLYLEKLLWGLHHQKYETKIEADESVSQLLFLDPAGQAVVQAEKLRPDSGYAAYFSALLRHPADFAGLYARHLFSGLDLQYATPFVRHPEQSTIGLALLNYTVWFLALLLAATWPYAAWRAHHWLALAAWLAPVLAVLPMSMECRFVLPLHLLAYALLAFGWPATWRWRLLSFGTRVRLAVAYAGFVLLCLALSGAAQASLEAGPRLMM